MSLTSFVRLPDVVAKIRSLHPKLPHQIDASLQVMPRSKRYQLIGTAFDYLLRFELQRRAPHAVSKKWIAEYAPDLLRRETGTRILMDWVLMGIDHENLLSPEEAAEHAQNSIKNAKTAVAAYLTTKRPTQARQMELATHAIRLAKLDPIYRASRLDPRFREVNSEDIQELVEMLAIVPFNQLLHSKRMLLNPAFKETSALVHGADVDLITGDLLVDFKTTKQSEMAAGDLDQLLGYLLLARKQHQIRPTFPVVDRLGLYYCRHGYLWSIQASVWTDHPEFQKIEQWFFKYAKKVFG